MDMILTGRPVEGPEAYAWGLANRLVPTGTARAHAEELAARIAAFPQACLRGDRMSALEQDGMAEAEAMRNELRHGLVSLPDASEGAARFAAGAGRHGSFLNP